MKLLSRMAALLLCGLLLAAPQRHAIGVELASAFSNHMVLQAGMPLRIWGRAEPGENIALTLWEVATATKADASGRWLIELPPQQPNAVPTTLRVVGNNTVELRDVLIGEVWVCAGQSNMEFALARATHAPQDFPQSSHSQLRLLDRRTATRFVSGAPFTPEQGRRLTAEDFYDGSWQLCEPDAANQFSAIGYFFGIALRSELSVPVGIIQVAVGGSPTEAWIRRECLAAETDLQPLIRGDWLENPNLGPWCKLRGRQNLGRLMTANTVPSDDLGPNHPFKPSFLWHSGVEPLVPLSIRGVLWYQGESNSLEKWRVEQHERLFPLLVHDWREQFAQSKLPFLICQLSSIGTAGGYKSEFWPDFRDQQRRLTQAIEGCGMVVTSDVGHPTDVHPRDKRTVADRLTRAALAVAYGKSSEYRGPSPQEAIFANHNVVLRFSHVTGRLLTGDGKPPASFELAGADRAFHAAGGTLQKDSVVLTSDAVAEPRFVRYGWQPYSLGNLVDAAGLPASTFEISVLVKN